MADPPRQVSYQQKYVRCGKAGCRRCADGPGHGPYWYAAWREGDRVRSRYIGKALPPGAAGGGPEAAAAGRQGSPAAQEGVLEPNQGGVVPGSATAPVAEVASSARAQSGNAGQHAAPPHRLRIWALGQFRVESAGVPVPDRAWRRQSATVVLKLLLLADHRRLPREHIASYLWPDADEQTARSQLASAVHALRRALEPGLAAGEHSRYLRQEGPNLVLALGPDDWVDYLAIEALLVDAAAASDPLPYLEQAAALYGGDLMPEEESAWCVSAREAMRLRWQGVLLSLAEAQAGHRQFDAAAATLSRLLTADPTNEEAARRLMGLLGRQGRRAEALRLYARLEQALREDLDTEPAPESEAIAKALRAGVAPPVRRRARPADPSRVDRTTVRPAASALVGRTSEMARLRAALLAAREGHGRAVFLVGAEGIGKTRLAEEVSTIATMLGFTVLWGRAAESEQDLPYAPVAEALHFYTLTRPPAALRRDLVGAGAVRALVPDLAGMLPDLAEPPPLENAGAERLRLWTAVRSLLAAAAISRPVLVTLEDLHWADEASLGLLSFLVRRVRENRLMLLGTLRDENLDEAHPVRSLMQEGQRQATLEVVPLAGLAMEDMGALAEQRQGGITIAAGPLAALYLLCGGNPLFANELLEMLREAGGDALGAVLTGTVELPAAIRQALGERVNRLSPACRAVLQVSAVIGDRSSVDLLDRVADLGTDSFEAAVDEALAAGFLAEEPLHGEQGYALTHALLRRILYDGLTRSQRQRLHGRAGDALALLAAGGRGPNAIVIAHHYAQSNDRTNAAAWLERAGDRAASVYAKASARAHYGRAEELMERAGARSEDAQANNAALGRLAEKLGSLCSLDGDYAAAQAHFARARALTRDPVQQAELWRMEGITWEKRGHFELALAAFASAEQGFGLPTGATGHPSERTPALPPVLQAGLALSRGDVYWGQGDFESAQRAAASALDVLRDEPEGPSRARAAHLLGRVAEVRGDYQRADACYRDCLAIRERIGDEQGIAACWYGLGQVAYDRGDPAEAEECHRRGLAIRERIGDQWGVAFSWEKLAQLAQYRGDYAQAEECNRRSLDLGERIGSAPGVAGAAYHMGQVACDHGDYADAELYIGNSLRIQERIGDQWGCSNSLRDLGDVARERGDLTLADQYYRRSLAIKERLGDQLGIASCLHHLGLLAWEQDDHRAAHSLGRRARRLAGRIGAHGMEAHASLGQALSALGMGHLCAADVFLAHSCALAATYGSARLAVRIALATAALRQHQRRLPEAIAAAQHALQLAIGGRYRREEALAQRALGLCALASADVPAALDRLRAACSLLEEIGAALDLERTQTALVGILPVMGR